MKTEKTIEQLFDEARNKFGSKSSTTCKRSNNIWRKYAATNQNKALRACMNAYLRIKRPSKVTDAESLSKLADLFIVGVMTAEECRPILEKALTKNH